MKRPRQKETKDGRVTDHYTGIIIKVNTSPNKPEKKNMQTEKQPFTKHKTQ